MRKWKLEAAKIKFEPRDLWIGIFWNMLPEPYQYGYLVGPAILTIVVCLVPTLPLIFNFTERPPKNG